jgi:hypothetical protein
VHVRHSAGLLLPRFHLALDRSGRSAGPRRVASAGAFGVTEIRSIPPRRHREEAFLCFVSLFEAKAHVYADTAAIDLARPQVNKIESLLWHPAGVSSVLA